MKIAWNGHACFTLECEGGTVVFDPYKDGSVNGLPPLSLKADAVLCSHYHSDHCGTGCVQLSGREFKADIEYIDSFHDEVKGAKRGANRIHIVSAEGMRVVHLGDQGCEPSETEIAQLRGCDVLMLPIGGTYTITSAQALELVTKLQPKIVIPMHYKSKGFGYRELESRDAFASKSFNPVKYPSRELTVTSDTPAQTVLFAE